MGFLKKRFGMMVTGFSIDSGSAVDVQNGDIVEGMVLSFSVRGYDGTHMFILNRELTEGFFELIQSKKVKDQFVSEVLHGSH